MDKKYEIIAATVVIIMVVVVGALGLSFKSLFTDSASPMAPSTPAQVHWVL